MRVWVAAALFLTTAVAGAQEEPTRRERLRWASEAQSLMNEKMFAPAAELLQKALVPGVAKSDAVHWWPVLGRCEEALGRSSRALAAYQEAAALQPKSIPRLLDLARLYDRVDLYDEAIPLYERVLARERGRQDVLFALASVNFRAGKLDPAGQYTAKALAAQPQDPGAQALMAKIEEARGDYAAAAHRLEAILIKAPEAKGYLALGQLWAKQGEYELADVSFNKAEGLGLSSAALYFQRGLAAWAQGKPDRAAALWKTAAKKDPNSVLPAFFLAVLDVQAGRGDEAAERLRRVRDNTESPYIDALTQFLLNQTGTRASARENTNG